MENRNTTWIGNNDPNTGRDYPGYELPFPQEEHNGRPSAAGLAGASCGVASAAAAAANDADAPSRATLRHRCAAAAGLQQRLWLATAALVTSVASAHSRLPAHGHRCAAARRSGNHLFPFTLRSHPSHQHHRHVYARERCDCVTHTDSSKAQGRRRCERQKGRQWVGGWRRSGSIHVAQTLAAYLHRLHSRRGGEPMDLLGDSTVLKRLSSDGHSGAERVLFDGAAEWVLSNVEACHTRLRGHVRGRVQRESPRERCNLPTHGNRHDCLPLAAAGFIPTPQTLPPPPPPLDFPLPRSVSNFPRTLAKS